MRMEEMLQGQAILAAFFTGVGGVMGVLVMVIFIAGRREVRRGRHAKKHAAPPKVQRPPLPQNQVPTHTQSPAGRTYQGRWR